VSANEQPENRG
nr:immunoglobulin heavy chain junction region [Homo sapiens]